MCLGVVVFLVASSECTPKILRGLQECCLQYNYLKMMLYVVQHYKAITTGRVLFSPASTQIKKYVLLLNVDEIISHQQH